MSEDQLSKIVDTIPALVWSAHPDGSAEFFNRRWLDYAGLSANEVQGWGWKDAVHPDDLNRLVDFWRSILSSGQPGEIEARLRRFDGQYRWFLFRASPFRDDSGKIVKWYGTNIDIEDRKQVEENLRRSEAFVLKAQRLSRMGSWKHDLSSGLVTISPEMLRVYDVQPDEEYSVLEFWFNRIHPEDRKRVQEAFQRSEIEKTEYQADYRIALPDGTVKYQHSIGYPILNESGDLVEFVGTAMDVTEQGLARAELEKALEQIERLTDRLRSENLALRASERELSSIVETIPGLVWCAAPDGELTYVNRRILDQIGTTLESLAQTGWLNFLHPDDVQPTIRAWLHAVETGQTHDVQYRMRRADGAYRWFHVLGQPVHNAEGGVARWYGLLIDIDDRKNMEEDLRRAQTRLSRATQVATVGELAASIAHEINQPLGAVVANGNACLRWLSAQPPNLAKAREAAGRIVRDGKEAGDVVQRVRALFKRASVEKVKLDLNEVIGEVIRILGGETMRRRVAMETDLQKDLPPVSGDRVQLQQLVLNLLLNGVEAMDSVVDRSRQSISARNGTARRLYSSRYRIAASGSRTRTESSKPSLLRRTMVWAWAWRFAVRLSKCMTGGCGRRPAKPQAQHSASLCRFTRVRRSGSNNNDLRHSDCFHSG
jgi:PAS domain S-box-containing protein